MLRRILTVSVIFIISLFIVNSAYAKKIDSTVLYSKSNKPYCNKGLQLFFSPTKDQFFCSRLTPPRTDSYGYIKKDGKPACKKPYTLAYIGETSKNFKKKPTCIILN